MECQECHQNPATLHFTKIINGKKTEIRLCEQCASEKGEFFSGSNNFTMNSLLSGLFNFDYPISEAKKKETEQIHDVLQCQVCERTYDQFLKKGRFGCANCYKVFKPRLVPVLKRVHSGNTKHGGKIPKRIGGDIQVRKQLNDLKKELSHCIANEEFERAAELRDNIKEIERKLRSQGEGE